ncbi:MAG: hypothetical protein R3F43_14400 [bacterium]
MTRSVALRLGVLVAGTMLSGCAWTFMTPPRRATSAAIGRGSAWGGWAGVDAAFAALSVVGAVVPAACASTRQGEVRSATCSSPGCTPPRR